MSLQKNQSAPRHVAKFLLPFSALERLLPLPDGTSIIAIEGTPGDQALGAIVVFVECDDLPLVDRGWPIPAVNLIEVRADGSIVIGGYNAP